MTRTGSTGGGTGTNQHAVKGVSKARRRVASRDTTVSTAASPSIVALYGTADRAVTRPGDDRLMPEVEWMAWADGLGMSLAVWLQDEPPHLPVRLASGLVAL